MKDLKCRASLVLDWVFFVFFDVFNTCMYIFMHVYSPQITARCCCQGGLTYEALAKLVYTEAVAMEAMRIYPPVTGFVLRETAREWTYGGYTFPAKSEVEVPVWSIHNDPTLYPEPQVFKPERWSQAVDRSNT